MCGRYTLYHLMKQLVMRFDIDDEVPEFPPSYNIAPSEAVMAVTEANGARRLDIYRWGLVPWWAEDPAIGNRLINARAESLTQKPAFRKAFTQRRCLIPADGFYEWKVIGGDGKKALRMPMYIHRPDNELFAFAGLWEEWRGPDGVHIRSCAIVTVEATEKVAAIHNRMPAILSPELEAAWLDPAAETIDLQAVLRVPYPNDALVAYEVSRRVNTATFKGAESMEPVAPGQAAANSMTGSLFD